jgi:pimeloyl-ACP methyl ester carboxylesterase
LRADSRCYDHAVPSVQVESTLQMHYQVTDFTDPWESADTVLLLHGGGEHSGMWYAWVPHLARHFRVLRPDLRGHGRSTVPPDPETYPWSAEGFAEDLSRLLHELGLDAVHVVGSKLGGPIALVLAAAHPEQVLTVTVLSGPARARGHGGERDLGDFGKLIREAGSLRFADEARDRAKYGADAPQGMIDWWIAHASEADLGVCLGVASTILPDLDLYPLLPTVQKPTLVMTSDRDGLYSVEATREWQELVPDSRLEIVPSDGWFIAAAKPDECAIRVREFLLAHSRSGNPATRGV